MPKGAAFIKVEGIVQGVFFRMNTKKVADGLGIVGWVRNAPDGSVEIMAEGEIDDIKELVKWALSGPPLAKVKKVTVEWRAYTGEFDSFKIIK